ncbi:uncharacterized protein LOC123534736 [Mercenaria mercenaria]|uniref:uncharacterized protein LOC123534736 n=1 Tax=Mercenaria mercenaria TaxID=6596 RepID=UPI00234ED438|nr:uncharacterized protein LOC123534736 [Mercenaria mercenaria]
MDERSDSGEEGQILPEGRRDNVGVAFFSSSEEMGLNRSSSAVDRHNSRYTAFSDVVFSHGDIVGGTDVDGSPPSYSDAMKYFVLSRGPNSAEVNVNGPPPSYRDLINRPKHARDTTSSTDNMTHVRRTPFTVYGRVCSIVGTPCAARPSVLLCVMLGVLFLVVAVVTILVVIINTT